MSGPGGGTGPFRIKELSQHRTGSDGRAFEERDRLAAVVDAGPGLLAARRAAREDRVGGARRASGRDRGQGGREGPFHFFAPAFRVVVECGVAVCVGVDVAVAVGVGSGDGLTADAPEIP